MKRDRSRTTLHGKMCIVCEGESTENNFCKDFIVYLESHNIDGVKRCDVVILPPPREDDVNPIPNARSVKQNRQIINLGSTDSIKIHPGVPPLKWISTGEDALRIYSEVWVMFDNDNHPARAEAFQKAKEIRASGKKLNVIYSSWSFEYFLLQHFEYLFYPFTTTEHRVGDKKQNCCTSTPLQGACNGELDNPEAPACITGYARKRKYWTNSKTANTFSLVNNIWMGICNAYSVKWEQLHDVWMNHSDNPSPIEELNPYLDTYRIVLRLMNYKELSLFTPLVINENIELTLSPTLLKIHNNTGKNYIINPENIIKYRYQIDNDDKLCHSEIERTARKIIDSDEDYYMRISPMEPDSFYIATFNDEKIFFKISHQNVIYTKEYLELYHYNDLN